MRQNIKFALRASQIFADDQMVIPRDKRRSQGKSYFFVLQYAQNLKCYYLNFMCIINMFFHSENFPAILMFHSAHASAYERGIECSPSFPQIPFWMRHPDARRCSPSC